MSKVNGYLRQLPGTAAAAAQLKVGENQTNSSRIFVVAGLLLVYIIFNEPAGKGVNVVFVPYFDSVNDFEMGCLPMLVFFSRIVKKISLISDLCGIVHQVK